jgi:hypothetical protein
MNDSAECVVVFGVLFWGALIILTLSSIGYVTSKIAILIKALLSNMMTRLEKLCSR